MQWLGISLILFGTLLILRRAVLPRRTLGFALGGFEALVLGVLSVVAGAAGLIDPSHWLWPAGATDTRRTSSVPLPRQVEATFNKPSHLKLGNTDTVQLIVHIKPIDDVSSAFQHLQGPIVSKLINVGSALSTTLTADKETLQISPRTGLIQTFNGNDVSWLWDVKPLKPGKTLVTLEVMSHTKTNGIEQVSKETALQETWQVEAEGLEWAKYYWNEYEWLRNGVYGIVAGILAILAWFGFKGFSKKTEETGST